MDLAEFWSVVEGSGTPEVLHDRLAALGEADLIAWERQHQSLMDASYRWDLWGAAYVIDGGCGDDAFDYFRAYLISRGRATYEAALANPDSLAGAELDEDDDWEDWMSPTMAVVKRRTGQYDYAAPTDASRTPPAEPAGERWDEDDLAARFPRLSERYDWD